MDTKDKQTIFKEEQAKTTNQATSTGLDENIAAALTYPFGFITGLIFLLIEKNNQFVKFHALQSIFTSISLMVVFTVIGLIPIIGIIVSLLMTPVMIIVSILLIYKAYKGEWFKVPFIGDLVENQLK
ncbi:MAG TPA: DUF4870 domain-containing protein [Pseudogracilibacillus sp.]|nr:DUF4870 domain-containing protein [Pseudogracilibacillus sp.]